MLKIIECSRTGDIPNDEDLKALMSRVDPEDKEEFKDTIKMFPTNALCEDENVKMLKSLNKPILVSIADDYGKEATDSEFRYEKCIYFCKGARIVLKENTSPDGRAELCD